MRKLLIGLSFAATVLATPLLAAEKSQVLVDDSSYEQMTSVDGLIFIPALPSEPTIQYAVIRYYALPQPFMLRPAHFVEIRSEYPEFDLRMLPAAQFRIIAFRDVMRERFGELGLDYHYHYRWT